MTNYTQQEAIKEIRAIAAKNGLTFKKADTRINNKVTYKFVDRTTGQMVIAPTVFWTAYENCMSGYVDKVAGNEQKPARNVVTTVEEYEIAGDRCWLVKEDGCPVANHYLDADELAAFVGEDKAGEIISQPAKDYQW